MVLSIAMNLFKHNKRSKIRVVHVLPAETTNDSIVLIDPPVDLVDSHCNDQLKLPKKTVDDSSKMKENSNVGKKTIVLM